MKKRISFALIFLLAFVFISSTCLALPAKAAEYQGLNYALVFDPDYYYDTYPDLQEAFGHDDEALYKHFTQCGMREGRIGCADFNVHNYRAAYKDLQQAFGDDWEAYYTHYLTYGIHEGRTAGADNPFYHNGLNYKYVFDPIYYADRYADLKAAFGYDTNALWQHFLTCGIQEGRVGNATFDVHYYRSAYADLNAAFGDDLEAYYNHYITNGRSEGRVTEPSDNSYLGVDYSLVYNKDYYLEHNPDVKAAFNGDDAATLNHFITFGMSEGRQASSTFNVKYYMSAYKDLQQAFGSDKKSYYIHYMQFGYKEGRKAISAAHTHSYTKTSETAATCSEEGVTTYTCSCGNSYTETTPALGHSWTLVSGSGSTVKSLVYKCSRCGATYSCDNPNYVEPSITCWGDSMTLGQYGDGTSYPGTLQDLTGIKTYNLGTSGETSIQIAVREGGITMQTGDDIDLPKGGSAEFHLVYTDSGEEVYIDPVDQGNGDYSGYGYTSDYFSNMCYINGQAYQIVYNGDTHIIVDSYGAKSDSDTIHIPAGTQVLTKASVDRSKDILVLEMGSNGGWNDDYDTLVAQYQSMIDWAGSSRYIILGDTDDPGESADGRQGEMDYGTGLNDTLWEAALRNAFGSHFLNVRTYLLQYGLSDNGLTPTDEDNDRYNYGKISLQLRTQYDNTHLCHYGYYSKGIAVYKKGQELGYW